MRRESYSALFIAAKGTSWELSAEGWIAMPTEHLSRRDVEDFLEDHLRMKKSTSMLDMQKHTSENYKSTQIFCEGKSSEVEQVYLQCFNESQTTIKNKFKKSKLSISASLFEPKDEKMHVIIT